MNCKECKTKNTKTAKFCVNCGKKLIEEEEEIKTNNTLDIIKENIKGIFKEPINTISQFIKDDNYMNALIFIGINIISIAIFILTLIKVNYKNIIPLINNYNYNYLYNTVSVIPYFKIFLISIMCSVMTYALITGILYLIEYNTLKAKESYKKIINWLGINSIFNTCSILISIICLLASLKLGIIVYLILTLVYIYNLFNTLHFASKISENKLGYVLTITIVLTITLLSIILPVLFY